MKRAVFLVVACMVLAPLLRAQPQGEETILLPAPDSYPHGVTSDGTTLWVTDYVAVSLHQIDPANGSVLQTFTFDFSSIRGVAWDGQYLWVASHSWLRKIDPQTGIQIAHWSGMDASQQGVAFDGTNLWVVSTGTGNISCVSPTTGAILFQFPSPASSPRGIEYHDGRLWHVDSYQDRIFEIDPATGAATRSFLVSRGSARGLARHAGQFWMVDKESRGIVGFPMVRRSPNTLSTAYVSRGIATCSFTNTSAAPYANAHVYMAQAESDHATEILSRRYSLNGIDTHPTGLVTDVFDQVTARIDIGTVLPGEAIVVAADTVARFWNWTVHVDLAQVGSLASVDPALVDLYTRDEELYDIHDPYIQAEAAIAVGTETNLFKMAHRIHDHVIESVTYDVASDWEKAATVLQQGRASCSGYVFAMSALCRARGIPTRFAGGSECRSFEAGRIDTLHHRWVEVFVPGYDWVPFDPTHDEWTNDDLGIRWREVGAQQRALVMRRGGGPNLMGWTYTSRARHDGGTLESHRAVVWTGLPWSDDGDIDGDGHLNHSDAFAYDRAAAIDSDGDGQPDDWSPGAVGADSTSVPPLAADPNDDNDSFSDTEEAIAGTDPTDPDSVFAFGGSAASHGALVLTWPSVDERIYSVWASETLDAPPVCVHDGIEADPPLNTYTTTCQQAQGFYRVRVSLEAEDGN